MRDDEETVAIRRCQEGDIAGLDFLIARHQLAALRLAYILTGDQGLGEDIVQESFLLAFRHIRQFTLGRPFAPWFLRIVTNATRSLQRSPAQQREISLAHYLTAEDGGEDESRLPPSAAIGPEQAAEQRETREALTAALAELTDKQREAVALRYYFGYADAEIATIVGCSVDTARHRLHDGLHALERIIRQSYPWLLEPTTRLSMPRKGGRHDSI